jgi:beta-glucosidase
MAQQRGPITDVLRDEWGFTGLLVSDWYGVNVISDRHLVARDHAEGARLALRAGVDLETPEQLCFPTFVASVTNGLISEALVDRAARRVLTQKFQMGLFVRPYVNPEVAAKTVGNAEARQAARELASEGMVLLKNENNLLPLNPKNLKTLAIVGPHAETCEIGNYSGKPTHKISVAEGIRAKLGDSVKVITAEGVRLLKPNADGKDDAVVLEDDEANLKRTAEAKAAVMDADAIVLCIGGNAQMSCEAWADYHKGDNASLELRAQQNELVRQMLATGKARNVTFTITTDKLAYHNLDHQYVVEAADFDLMTGPDSEHLQTVTLNVPKTIPVP